MITSVIVENQNVKDQLEHHKGGVCITTWNETYNKLTTVDNKGVMIIWMNLDGKWRDEMLNESEKSLITDVKWSGDGTCVSLIISDGQFIIGTVDGNRVGMKKLAKTPVKLEW